MSTLNQLAPVADARHIERELSHERFVRKFRDLEIYLVSAIDAPAVMNRVGHIREVEFRAEGGGTGKPIDIDDFDYDPDCGQLIAWDPKEGEIVSMYRYMCGNRASSEGRFNLPTARLFDFSARFAAEYLPVTIELGRSVVNRSARKKLHGLHAVWSGLGALISELPDMSYFFGKVTTYEGLGEEARAILFHFMDAYFGDREELVRPKQNLAVPHRLPDVAYRGRFSGLDYKREFADMRDIFSELGATIPPLFISYSGLSSSMKVFGTARNPHFGDVLETAILVKISDIRKKYIDAFVSRYESVNPSIFQAQTE